MFYIKWVSMNEQAKHGIGCLLRHSKAKFITNVEYVSERYYEYNKSREEEN